MNVHPDGREYILVPITSAPAGATTFEVSLDGDNWVDATVDGSDLKFLVAGYEATQNPEDTLVLKPGVNHVLVRLVSEPEVIIRRAARITCD